MTIDSIDIDLNANWRVILVAIVVVLAGCPSGPSNTVDDTGSKISGSPSEPASASTAADSMPTEMSGGTANDHSLTGEALNESFVVGTGANRVRYTITDRSRADRIGGEFGIDADTQFVVVRVTVTNLGDNITRVTGNMFTLIAADGEQYPTDSQAMNAAEDALLVRDLGPDATVRGVLIFDVPPARESLRLRVTAPQS